MKTILIKLHLLTFFTELPRALLALGCVGQDPSVLGLLLHGHLLVAGVSLAQHEESVEPTNKEAVLATSLQMTQLLETSFSDHCWECWLEQGRCCHRC